MEVPLRVLEHLDTAVSLVMQLPTLVRLLGYNMLLRRFQGERAVKQQTGRAASPWWVIVLVLAIAMLEGWSSVVASGPSPFRQLGVQPNASTQEIRSAFHTFILHHHPDKGGDPARFIEGRLAYETLSEDPRLPWVLTYFSPMTVRNSLCDTRATCMPTELANIASDVTSTALVLAFVWLFLAERRGMYWNVVALSAYTTLRVSSAMSDHPFDALPFLPTLTYYEKAIFLLRFYETLRLLSAFVFTRTRPATAEDLRSLIGFVGLRIRDMGLLAPVPTKELDVFIGEASRARDDAVRSMQKHRQQQPTEQEGHRKTD